MVVISRDFMIKFTQRRIINMIKNNNVSPVIPDGWTFLVHNTSVDRWKSDQQGQDFKVSGRLCCVTNEERLKDKTSGSAYGSNETAFQIRVLFFDDLIHIKKPENTKLKAELSQEALADITKWYSFQGWRHPAVPNGTKLIKISETDYDEALGVHKPIYWYVPEKYFDMYKNMCKKNRFMQGIKSADNKNTKISAVMINSDRNHG